MFAAKELHRPRLRRLNAAANNVSAMRYNGHDVARLIDLGPTATTLVNDRPFLHQVTRKSQHIFRVTDIYLAPGLRGVSNNGNHYRRALAFQPLQ